ncbi:MAG: cysteine desulfurase/selenocysteine lyase [Parcubacteria group bacterium Gr01-1014_13]|nr:MAG: cysteine desulfurase/selenocysteine lyase [Parcubacteria group bacterium Gr01-1014_13]
MKNIQKQFPILKRKINGKPLVYLDSASTSQKPTAVLLALQKYYTTSNANIHRGIHTLSEEATAQYEDVRKKVAKFIGAKNEEEVIFTKNCTEAINCVSFSWAKTHITKGDEIIVSALEHHANLVPWQELAKEKGAILKIIPITSDYLLDLEAYEKLLSEKTKLVCVTAQSNVTGTIVPVKKITAMAHAVGAKVLVDGAQMVGHAKINVRDIDCDFFAFSAHKMLGPTGVGVLYVKQNIMAEMTPYMYGGDMVESVQQQTATYRTGPWKFEAGTPNIADVIAFGAAIDYLENIGLAAIAAHDRKLLAYAKKRFSRYPAVKLFSPSHITDCGGVLSFTVTGVHPHDIATIFNQEGVTIRSGLHCAEPLVGRLGVNSTARMSFYLYNTTKDIDMAEKALQKVLKIFKIK